jgi:hypothetical protein
MIVLKEKINFLIFKVASHLNMMHNGGGDISTLPER